MALIEVTVGPLPCKLLDFDQHSYEAQDCSTPFMPKSKIDTAVCMIELPSVHNAPHAEGLCEPADFYGLVEGLGDQKRRDFLRDNGLALFDVG